MSGADELIRAEHPAEHLLLIRIARPAKRNALTNAMVVRMGEILAEAADGDAVRCAVITGDETAFSAGADIAEVRERGADAVNDPARVAAWRRIERFPKPLIAAVNGIAFGAGNELAMVCDFIVAGRNARFGQPEVNIGGMPGDGGTQRLPRKVGSNVAAYMLLSGEPISAETALRIGLAVELCDPAETVDRALAVARTIASRAPLAVREVKACIQAAGDTSLAAGLAVEREALWRIINSPDRVEGATAFLEKRPPRFTGRWS